MSSILLSFVGNQDPASEQTNEPGSIVTLVYHLLEQNNQISRIILLYTQGTKEAAFDTKEWLLEVISNLKITEENIELISVDNRLSQDPVDLLLAIYAARQALEKVKTYLNKGDFLELNASSGTPVMKSAWSILQAAGYAPQSRVWQVRNPDKTIPGQNRVFEANVDTLKKEFDLKIIKQQVQKYDYNGALITFESSNLVDNGIGNLLRCGCDRLASSFDTSFEKIKNYSNILDNRLYKQSKNLAARHHREIIKEIYFQACIKAENKEFSELLVKIFIFQESVLFYLIKQKLLSPQDINVEIDKNIKTKLWETIKVVDYGKLQLFLNNYRLDDGKQLNLNSDLNRIVMMAIVEYFYDRDAKICEFLRQLNQHCQKRNDYIHQLKGVNNIEGEQILKTMREIMKILQLEIKPNPFCLINQKINELLDNI